MQSSLARIDTQRIENLDNLTSSQLPSGPKLNLGCGPVQPEAWVNVDASLRSLLATKLSWLDGLLVTTGVFRPTEYNKRTTTYHNLAKGLPYPDNSVACVYAGELWEHFEYADASRLTKEVYRVLKPGGVLRVCVPDGPTFWGKYLDLYRAEMAKPPEERDAKKLNAQTQLFFNDICTHRQCLMSIGHLHKWNFDEVQLADLLKKNGFSAVQRMAFHDSRIPDVALVERSDFLIVEGVKGGTASA